MSECGATFDANGQPVDIGDVVQVNPASHQSFGGCFVIVEEVMGWGVVGFTIAPAGGAPAHCPFRAESGDFVRVGRAPYLVAS